MSNKPPEVPGVPSVGDANDASLDALARAQKAREKASPEVSSVPKVEVSTEVVKIMKDIDNVYIGGKYYSAKRGETKRWPVEVCATFRTDDSVL